MRIMVRIVDVSNYMWFLVRGNSFLNSYEAFSFIHYCSAMKNPLTQTAYERVVQSSNIHVHLVRQ